MDVDLQSNVVTITPARDRTLDLAAVPRAVRGSGQRPGAMRLRARGAFEPSGGGRAFRIAGWPEPLAVREPGALAAAGEGEVTIEAAVAFDGDEPVLARIEHL